MTIEKIISGCIAKERKFQKELYLLTAEDLMRVITRYIDDQSTAKDIFQDAYIRIFEKIHLYDSSKGSIGAWTGRLATNLALAYLRKKKTFSSLDNLPLSIQTSTELSAIDNLAADELFALIKLLPKNYRIVFLLNVVEGYSHQEISDQLGITASTSRSQLVRARAKLKDIIQKKSNLNHKYYVEAQ